MKAVESGMEVTFFCDTKKKRGGGVQFLVFGFSFQRPGDLKFKPEASVRTTP